MSVGGPSSMCHPKNSGEIKGWTKISVIANQIDVFISLLDVPTPKIELLRKGLTNSHFKIIIQKYSDRSDDLGIPRANTIIW